MQHFQKTLNPRSLAMDLPEGRGKGRETRDSIEDIYGPRTPYKHEWPNRVDENTTDVPDRWIQSACIMCSNGCGCDIGVKGGKVVGVRGRAVDRVNKGRLGPKGLNAWTAIHHPDRLTHPLIRKDGKLTKATWDEAMSLIVKQSKYVRDKLTAHGIAFYTSGQLFLEEYYALAMIGKAGLNTLHMDGNTRLCTATAAASMRESFGSDGQPGSYTDIDYTDCLFMVGHNMSHTQTVLWSRVLDRLNGPDPPQLIVIDPRKSDTAAAATIHLAPRIGTNLALLNGIQHLLFENGWINEAFVTKHCVGLDELKAKVKSYTPQMVEAITSVPAHQLCEAARVIGTSASLLSTCLQGVYQSNQATASACQVNNINLLLGKIGKPGSGVLQMNGQPTAQNNREAGCDGEFPGFRNPKNPNHMQELARLWNIEYAKVPHWNQPTHIMNILSYIENDSVQMLWVSGTNPLVSLPNLHRTRQLFSKPGLFLVVQDIFPTETTELADVVLPAAQWGEKTGCFTNVDRTVHLSLKAVEPPGEAKSDFEIFVDYARRMDFRDKDGAPLMPWKNEEDAFVAWKQLSLGRPCDYSELSYAKLTGGSGIQWPCNKDYPYGKERLFDDGVFFTDIEHCESFGHDLETGAPYNKEQYETFNPNGKAILKACHYIPDPEEPDEKYPLRLSTGRNVYHFHTRTKTGRSPRLQNAFPEPVVIIHTEDAKGLDVHEGEQVIVRSRRGAVQLRTSLGGISRGQIFIPFHFGYFDSPDGKARAANELTIGRWDAVSKQPCLKSGSVRIEKCQAVSNVDAQTRPEVKQEQTKFVQTTAKTKPNADDIHDDTKRERHLEVFLGCTYESIRFLLEACDQMIPNLIHEPEVQDALAVLQRIINAALEDLKPFVKRYHTDTEYGHEVCKHLLSSICPASEREQRSAKYQSPYGTLTTLVGLKVYLSYIDAQLQCLTPVSQALWDEEFQGAVAAVQSKVDRLKSWVDHLLVVRSPQTLIVPALPILETSNQE